MKSFKSPLVFLLPILILMTWVNWWVYSKPDHHGVFDADANSSYETQKLEDGDEDRIDLDGMIEYLRADDDRLVRFNIDS